jgi:uncharacterized membrane protein YecN with MAPEG domain
MATATVCTALLGLLVFGLGFGVSLTRTSSNVVYGYDPDPTDRLYKMVRAHGNATEYNPMLAVLILAIGARNPSGWMMGLIVAATAARYLHAVGMITAPTLNAPHPLRFMGALGTYVCGLGLVLALLLAG